MAKNKSTKVRWEKVKCGKHWDKRFLHFQAESRPRASWRIKEQPWEHHPSLGLYEWKSLELCSAQPAWLYRVAMNIFRVTNIPNRGRKWDNLLLGCPETGSQKFPLAKDGILWPPNSVPMLREPPDHPRRAGTQPILRRNGRNTGTAFLLGEASGR